MHGPLPTVRNSHRSSSYPRGWMDGNVLAQQEPQAWIAPSLAPISGTGTRGIDRKGVLSILHSPIQGTLFCYPKRWKGQNGQGSGQNIAGNRPFLGGLEWGRSALIPDAPTFGCWTATR